MTTPQKEYKKFIAAYEERNLKAKNPAVLTNEDCFTAGWQASDINKLVVLAKIRDAVGDPTGKLMQDELVAKIERAFVKLK